MKENPKDWSNSEKFEKPDSVELLDIACENTYVDKTESLRVDGVVQIHARVEIVMIITRLQ